MRVLVTGSSGQLGATVAELLSTGHEPVGIDLIPGRWTQRVMSIVDRAAVFEAAREVDAIIHTASLHHPHVATHSRQAFVDTNITGTLNLLEAAVQSSIQRFVYSSTTSLYGEAMVPIGEAVWVTEELVPRYLRYYQDCCRGTVSKHCPQHRYVHTLPAHRALFRPYSSIAGTLPPLPGRGCARCRHRARSSANHARHSVRHHEYLRPFPFSQK